MLIEVNGERTLASQLSIVLKAMLTLSTPMSRAVRAPHRVVAGHVAALEKEHRREGEG